MKYLTNPLISILLIVAMNAGAAQTDLMGVVKNIAGAQNGATTDSGSATSALSGALGSLLGGDAKSLQSSSAANVGGVLQYCVQNNVLDAANNKVTAIKDQLMGKLGTQTESKPYADGLNGILNTKNGQQIDLNNLGSMTASLKQKATTKVCDVILSQAKNFL